MKHNNVTDQWVNTQPDGVNETRLGKGYALIGEDLLSFSDAWMRVDTKQHATAYDDFFGAPATLSSWDTAVDYFMVFFFDTDLRADLPEPFLLWVTLEKFAVKTKGQPGMELWVKPYHQPHQSYTITSYEPLVIPTVFSVAQKDGKAVTLFSVPS